MAKEKNEKSSWSEKAEMRIRNKKWLRYSSNIARRILSAIEDMPDMSQSILAEKIGVTPQYISKLIKGQENLSLETIAKLSDALSVELISFPEYKYSQKKHEQAQRVVVKINQERSFVVKCDKVSAVGILPLAEKKDHLSSYQVDIFQKASLNHIHPCK